MNLKSLSVVVPVILLTGLGLLMLAGKDAAAVAQNLDSDATVSAGTPSAVPYADSSSVALKFEEIFVTPAGPRGLEYTAKARALDGKKVAVTGFMLRNDNIDPAIFFFCETLQAYNEREEGLSDSLPPSMVHVILPVKKNSAPAWRQEKMTLYGTLDLGSRQEQSGRVSHVRLHCDVVTDAATGAPLELRKPVALQLGRAIPIPSDLGALPSSTTPPPFFNPRRNRNSTTHHPDKL
ncbi:MAG: hypothetical protein B7Z37_00440 [Verrucomicrobia bacterium 12-59-8]|nr:MAG: hypothetical protein B7Z37_00440 [Verrucomicrobia bacterium 12-59-8]